MAVKCIFMKLIFNMSEFKVNCIHVVLSNEINIALMVPEKKTSAPH